jgi:hypothetical protein
MSTEMESAPNYIVNWNELVQHFVAVWPNEACGYVTQDNVFVPCENKAEKPREDFLIAAETFIGVEPKCIVHSHCIDNTKPLSRQPLQEFLDVEVTEENAETIKYRDEEYDPRIPTSSDLQGQIDTACEWAICVVSKNDCSLPYFWGDYDHRPDLMKRQFIYNMNDCLSFMFEWYYKKWKVQLPNIAREWCFYKGEDDLFINSYAKWGFTDATHLTPEVGDVFLWRYGAKVVSHCGVYVGDGQAAHHMFRRLPSLMPRHEVEQWNKYLVKRVRYEHGNKHNKDDLSSRRAG